MQNSNGTFVDMATIPEDVLEAVQRFVDYCHRNKGMLEDYNNRLAECRMNQDFERLPRRSSSVQQAANSAKTSEPSDLKPERTNASDHGAQDDDEGGGGAGACADGGDDESVTAAPLDGKCGSECGGMSSANHTTAPAMTLSSVTRRMTTSKFNQAKKRIMRKRTSTGPAVRSNEMSGFLMPERYIMHSPVQR
jgi:hypothetical protein